MIHTSKSDVQSLEDAFVQVSFYDDCAAQASADKLYDDWVKQASGKRSDPEIYAADALRKLYPNHSLVISADWQLNLLRFPGAYAEPVNPSELVTEAIFVPLPRHTSTLPGILVESVAYGAFKFSWEKYQYLVYIAKWLVGFGQITYHFILHEGPEEPSRDFLVAAGAFSQALHDEIWVYNQGFWNKDTGLYSEVQKANWNDVILKETFKKSLKSDVYSFFKSEDIYKELAIPWKRGIIMYGPPGNGKTISIKAIMKAVQAEGHSPLYVKSFQSWKGEEGSMADVFEMARKEAPCVLVLEDLDSLINDRNRSFFLNQLDGLEGNDGLLVIGTTNHFERLDPGLSTRPSRFDRKYLFDDPDRDERALYAKYWQKKLAHNEDLKFPDSLVTDVANLTSGFSFAYLKEAFVSCLVLLALDEEKKTTFEAALKAQIKSLRDQLDKTPRSGTTRNWTVQPASVSMPITLPKPDTSETRMNFSMSNFVHTNGRYFSAQGRS
ncbi:P-loop containing nucleoside triphosphate hydrolase protein [Rickenella mellea]|uniref:P-loop containing nucleoside triphosphate hydrolase protein n=1 Tax=Rickenella mellea TaxID=50990 RepID=A0A4R5XER4_9AGAM|nr:P-loop containing nucleoside triphosphate hydrolase protein [Rickenella mellea]